MTDQTADPADEYDQMERDLKAAEAKLQQVEQEKATQLAECYRLSGADSDGNDALRASFDAARDPTAKEPVRHGTECPKVPHDGGGFLHAPEDDKPYDVDGVMYCGRCHWALTKEMQ